MKSAAGPWFSNKGVLENSWPVQATLNASTSGPRQPGSSARKKTAMANLSRKFQKRGKFSSAATGFQNANLPPGTVLCPKNVHAVLNRFFSKKRRKMGLFCSALITNVVIQSLWHDHILYREYFFSHTQT